jgi:nitroreductase
MAMASVHGRRAMEFQQVVARRRMVRHFSAEPIEHKVLERIALTAQRAPSAGFSQGQRLVVVTDPGVRRRVAENCSESYYVAEGFHPWISEAPALFVPCVSEAIYLARYAEPDKVAAEVAYHALYGETNEAGPEDAEWPVPYWWVDIGCTVMLVLLAAVDEGLAAGFVSSGDHDGLRAELGIPADFTPVGVIPVGRKLPDKGSSSIKRGWVPREDFVRWERWE